MLRLVPPIPPPDPILEADAKSEAALADTLNAFTARLTEPDAFAREMVRHTNASLRYQRVRLMADYRRPGSAA